MSQLSTQKSPLPGKIYITRSARRLIEEEARRGSTTSLENETGGILVGRRLDGEEIVQLLIIAATGPGENAYHHPVEFNPDIDYVNGKLQEYHARYPKTDYIGTWHKHPARYQTFSAGDVATAHAVFRDPAYKINEIINPIVWVDRGEFTIRYYYMSRQMAQRREPFVEIQASRVHEIDDEHPLIQRERADGASSPPINDRIGEEHRLLRERGYQVTLKSQDTNFFFEVRTNQHPDLTIYLMAPNDFPRVPPALVAIERAGTALPQNDDGVINQWTYHNGNSHLVDVVEGVLRAMPVAAALPIAPVVHPSTPSPVSPPSRTAARKRQNGGFVVLVAALSLVALGLFGFVGWQIWSSGEQVGQPQGQEPLTGIEQTPSATLTLDQTASDATATAALQATQTQTAIAMWIEIDNPNLSLSERIAKLQERLKEGETTDPRGRDITQLIHDARLLLINDYLAAEPPEFDLAREVAKQAQRAALSMDDEAKQRANDWFVKVLMAEVRTKIDTENVEAQKLVEARTLLSTNWPEGNDSQISRSLQEELSALRTEIRQAVDALGDVQRLEAEWASYDKAVDDGNWQQAVRILDEIVATTGLLPDPVAFQGGDPRISDVAKIQSETRLKYARALWRDGKLDDAQAQINEARVNADFLRTNERGDDALDQSIDDANTTQTQADELWSEVEEALNRTDWRAVLDALSLLEQLDDFGSEAVRPSSAETAETAETVAKLKESANRALAADVSTPRPTPNPAATAQAQTTTAVAQASATAAAAAAASATANAEATASAVAATAQAEALAQAQTQTQTAEEATWPLYRIAISEISENEMTEANGGTPPPNVNVLLVGPSDAILRGGDSEIRVSFKFMNIDGRNRLTVESVGGETKIRSTAIEFSFEKSKYYKITVSLEE
ncbi:Mov34/MPN/PAD-1 family protein [Candidatus Chloroploca sp. Khr17]|uniref:Mov34/MPN/PAD-1 family protein n=1 Tax=Candidatus Chloroploca sp. Khr17 TaxID=2496869 RepID=UPI00101CCA9B|nr:Mov34/MPN/PAD-1 family protein [Candidatus Chloroploca sp. Khr17]